MILVAILSFIAGASFVVLLGVYTLKLPSTVWNEEGEDELEARHEEEIRALREKYDLPKQDVAFYRDLYSDSMKTKRGRP